MKIPILSGITTDAAGDFRTSYPKNMIPVPKSQGISAGYLKPAEGIEQIGTGPGVCRGATKWQGQLYAVMGTKLVRISRDGATVELGDVGGSGRVVMEHSFDYLAIASSTALWLWDGATLAQNTDLDLGVVKDVVFANGYFVTTDGEFLVTLELDDPFSVDPLKYGSSEADPDPVVGLQRIGNEIYALNRYTIEVFGVRASTGFPFARITGAQIQKGCVGAQASARFLGGLAFLGGGESDTTAVWLGGSGQTRKISDREIDTILEGYNETELAAVHMQARSFKNHSNLYLHLPDQTLVYDAAASQAMERPVWHILHSGSAEVEEYRVTDMVWLYNQWNVFDTQSGAIGRFTDETGSHWGSEISWEFGTPILWNKTDGAILHEIELTALTGRVTGEPTVSTSYSQDGRIWSSPRFIKAGARGDRHKRLIWLNQGSMRRARMQRFQGSSDAHLSFVSVNVRAEGLTA